MAKKPNVLPHPQNALNKFMVRIIIERDRLNDAFALDGHTAYPSITMTPKHLISAESCQDNAGKLVESHLEDMYSQLYTEPFELRVLLIETTSECIKADSSFAVILIPSLSAMVKVHMSCINDLRNGKGWNWEAHCEAFEILSELSGAYADKLAQMTTTPDDKPVETQSPAKKLKPLSKDEVKRAKWILKTKKGKYLGSPITDGTIAQFFINPKSFTKEFQPNPAFEQLTTKQGVSKALKRYANSLNSIPPDNQLSPVDHS